MSIYSPRALCLYMCMGMNTEMSIFMLFVGVWVFEPVCMYACACVFMCLYAFVDGCARLFELACIHKYIKNKSGHVRMYVFVGTGLSPSSELLLTSLSPPHGLPSSPDDRLSLFRSPCWPPWQSLSFLLASLGNPKSKWGACSTWQQHSSSCSGYGQPYLNVSWLWVQINSFQTA